MMSVGTKNKEGGCRRGDRLNLFTISDVAECFHVATRTVRRWISPAIWWPIGLEASSGSPRAICGSVSR